MSFFGIPIRNSLAIGLGSLVPLSSRPSPLVSALALNLNFLTPTLDPRITFARADATTCATLVNASGVLETVAANIPRFDYDPITLACKGLLIEESRANIALQSNALLTLPWTGFATITGNFTNVTNQLTGLTDAWQIVEMAVTGQRLQRQDITTTNTLAHTISLYVKALPGSLQRYVALRMGDATNISTSNAAAIFDPNTGAVVLAGTNTGLTTGATTSVQNCGNGWYRISLSCVPYTSGTSLRNMFSLTNVANNPVPSYLGDVNSGVLVYGYQCEVGTFPTSYIPTAASAVTRAADSALVDGTNFSSWYNQSEGTFVCGAVNQFVTGVASKTWLHVSDVGLANRFSGVISTIGKVNQFVVSGAVTQAASLGNALATLVANTPFKTAFAYKVNDFAISADGQTSVTDTLGALPIAVDRMRIGGVSTTNTPFNGHIRQVSYYNTRLTNAQLQAVST